MRETHRKHRSWSDLREKRVLVPEESLLLGLRLDGVLRLYGALQGPRGHQLTLHVERRPLLHRVSRGHLNGAQVESTGSFLQEHLGDDKKPVSTSANEAT